LNVAISERERLAIAVRIRMSAERQLREAKDASETPK